MAARSLPAEFKLERFFARWEFNARHLLSSSDCEPFTVAELLELAGAPPDLLAGLRLGYTESQGDPELRRRIAARYPGLSADDILVTNAPEEAIFLLTHTLLGPGDRVVVQTPCYQSLVELPRSLGCDVVPWPLVETDRGWRADLDRLAGALAGGARLLVLNAPHNPTGWLPSRAEMDDIARLAAERGARLFCDEMYRGLERAPGDELPPAATREGGISLWGMSKSFALAGLRIGWLALRDRALIDRMLRLKDYTTICASAPGELLARVALDAAEPIFARNRAIIHENLALARAFPAWSWREPAAGSVAFVRVPAGAAALADDAAERLGVLLVPATVFDAGDAHVRIGLGRRGFAEGLRVLAAGLRAPG